MGCKIEAQLEYVLHIANTFCTFGADMYSQLALISKISALELSHKFIKGLLLVGNLNSPEVSLTRLLKF